MKFRGSPNVAVAVPKIFDDKKIHVLSSIPEIPELKALYLTENALLNSLPTISDH